MAIESWIDSVVDVAGSVESHKRGGKVRAYYVAKRGEIPEALSEYPCAIVYPTRVKKVDYGASIGKEIWEIRAEFYLFADTKKSNLPEVIRYFTRIRNATLAKPTLGGLVDHFQFGEGSMQLVAMEYEADQPARHGILVDWEVKADVGSEIGGYF